MMDVGPRQILVLYWHPGPEPLRAAIAHHLRALDSASLPHRVVYFNTVNGAPAWLRRAPFDAIVLHTTFLCMRWSHLFPRWKWPLRWLSEVDIPKLAMPQDEYDHSEILDEWLFELGVTDVFSNFDESKRPLLYPIMAGRARFHKCFTGYVDEGAASRCSRTLVPLSRRPREIVYRATKLPYWFGSHGQLKHAVGAVMGQRAAARRISTDISTRPEDTIVGDRWFDFLMSGRTIVGCESGSSVLDRRGEIRARIQALLSERPELDFEAVSREMPSGWDGYRFFALSPRHFEAVISRTCQILVEGDYEGVLKPERHYLSLKRDWSNVEDILEQLADVKLLENVTAAAYEEIYASGRFGYDTFAREIEQALFWYPPIRRPRGGARRCLLWAAEKMAARRASGTSSVAGRLVRAPRSAVPRAWLTLRTVRDSDLRALLLAYFGDPASRRMVRSDVLLGDLVRLDVIRRAMRTPSAVGFAVRAGYDAERSQWTYESLPLHSDPGHPASGGRDALPAGAPLQRIIWDHRDVGRSVSWRSGTVGGGTIPVGPAGVHDFTALVMLAARQPQLVWRALGARENAG